METKIYKIELQVSELIVQELLEKGVVDHLCKMAESLFGEHHYNFGRPRTLDAEKALQVVSVIKQTEDILSQIRSSTEQQDKENLETTSELCRDVLDDAG